MIFYAIYLVIVFVVAILENYYRRHDFVSSTESFVKGVFWPGFLLYCLSILIIEKGTWLLKKLIKE